MAFTFSGEGFNPSAVATYPRISNDGRRNEHLGGCNFKLFSFNLSKIALISFRCCSNVQLNITMSSI